jgi:plasmid stabilization system protein ParE
MDRRVVWTETAWSDLEQVVTHIAKDSSHYAAAFTREARDASRSLSRFSNRGRVVPEFNNPTLREVFVRSYRLLYTVSKDAVYTSLASSTARVTSKPCGNAKDDRAPRSMASSSNPVIMRSSIRHVQDL